MPCLKLYFRFIIYFKLSSEVIVIISPCPQSRTYKNQYIHIQIYPIFYLANRIQFIQQYTEQMPSVESQVKKKKQTRQRQR